MARTKRAKARMIPLGVVRKDRLKDMSDKKEVVIQTDNGEVETKWTQDYKYVPELDDPPPVQAQPPKMLKFVDGKIVDASTVTEEESPFQPIPQEKQESVPELDGITLKRIDPDMLQSNNVSKLRDVAGVGQSAFIIGGGHSWGNYRELLRIHKDRTFGCSGVPLIFPELKYWYSCDVLRTPIMQGWFFKSTNTVKILCYEAWKGEEVRSDCYLCTTPPHGPTEKPWENGLWHGCSSVIGAMETARLMGFKTILLFGVDYNETTHPFDSYDPQQAENRKPWDRERVQRHWTQVRDYYHDFRVNVFNCNPESLLVKLNIQRYIEPEKAFSSAL